MYVCIIIRLAYSLICSGLHGCFFGGCSSLGSQWNGTILGSLILAESFTKRMLAELRCNLLRCSLDRKVAKTSSHCEKTTTRLEFRRASLQTSTTFSRRVSTRLELVNTLEMSPLHVGHCIFIGWVVPEGITLHFSKHASQK